MLINEVLWYSPKSKFATSDDKITGRAVNYDHTIYNFADIRSILIQGRQTSSLNRQKLPWCCQEWKLKAATCCYVFLTFYDVLTVKVIYTGITYVVWLLMIIIVICKWWKNRPVLRHKFHILRPKLWSYVIVECLARRRQSSSTVPIEVSVFLNDQKDH